MNITKNQTAYMGTLSDGHIVKCFSNEGMVKLFDSNGNEVGIIARNMARPSSIVINRADTIYVAESQTGIIHAFDKQGQEMNSFGGLTSTCETGKFAASPDGCSLYHLVIDSEDNLYASDLVQNTIHKFTSTGTFITSFGRIPASNCRNISLDIDNEDYLYVTDVEVGIVKKYDKEGHFICDYDMPSRNDGRLFIAVALTDRDNDEYGTSDNSEEKKNTHLNLIRYILSFFEPSLRQFKA